MITDIIASTQSTPATLTLAEAYIRAKRFETHDGFAYPEGTVTFEHVNNEYATFPVVYEMDVRDAIAAVALSKPKFFTDIKVIGKLVDGMTIFVVIATNKSRDDAEIAQGFIARAFGGATIPFSVKGDIVLDEDFLAEDEDICADGIAACIDEPAPVDPALEEAYASLEKAEMELSADPTSKSKARKVMLCQKRISELGGEV